MRNALSFDVEDYYHVSALASAAPRKSWGKMPQRVEANTCKLFDLLAEHQISATFFFLGCVAEGHPQLVRRARELGHEVACHGHSHTLVYDQSEKTFREETLRAKCFLEDHAQQPILGYRAASYSITRRSLWALDVLAELGFQYDSSIFPVLHDRYGIPGARREPHVMILRNGRSLVEFPLTTALVAGYRLPAAGGGYFRIFPYAVSRWALQRTNAAGMPFIFYLHPWEIDPHQPRLSAGAISTFRHYTNLGRCEQRLKRLLSEFQFHSAANVLRDLGLLPDSSVGSENGAPLRTGAPGSQRPGLSLSGIG